MHAVADISKNLPMGTVLERQEQGQQQSTVPNVFSLLKYVACGWMNRNEENVKDMYVDIYA